MRILLLSNLYPPHVEGGAEILASNIAAGLERLGHEVFVLTSTYGLSRHGQRNGSHKRHQPEKISSASVGAREDDVELGGPLWSPVGGEYGPLLEDPSSSGVPRRATIKAHHPSTQPPSPPRNPRLGRRLMPIGWRWGPGRRKRPHHTSSTLPSLQWRILQYVPTAHFDRQRSLWSQFQKLFNYYRRYHNAANAKTLREIIAATSPDILYIWEITGIGVNSLLKVLPEFKIPIVFHLGSYWLLYARSPETEQSRMRIRWLKQLLIGSVPELTWTSLIAVSVTVKQEYTRAGFDPKRIEVIYNGINPSFLTLPRSASNEEEICQLLFAGRIRAEKGVLIILKALHLLMHNLNDTALLSARQYLNVPPLRLHIFGDGDQMYMSELKTFLRENGLEELVIFHGKVPQDELIQYYDHCQIMLVPSLWQEPFGLVVAEAMARGLPVIASNVGGLSEIITHEKNGLLVEAGDERALALAMSQLIQDPDKRQRLGEAARTTVQERFMIEENVNRVEQHLQHAINCENLRSG